MKCLLIFRDHKWRPISNVFTKRRNRTKLLNGLYQCKRCKTIRMGDVIEDPPTIQKGLV